MVKNLSANAGEVRDTCSIPGLRRSPGGGNGNPLQGFPHNSVGKESACNVGDPGSIPGWENPLEKGKAIYSSILNLENPMDRGTW